MKRKLNCIVLCLVTVLFIMGCGVRITDGMSPAETTEAFLQCVKTQDEGNIGKIYEGKKNDFLDLSSNDKIKKAMKEKWLDFDYKIGKESISKDGETAKVKVDITTYDMATVFNDYYLEYMERALEEFSGKAATTMTDKALDRMSSEILKEKVEKAKEKTFHAETALTLTRKGDRWIVNDVKDNAQFLNAITGGMLSVMNEVADTMRSN